MQVTAYGFLKTLQVPEGEYLLQTAAGSTLGRQLIALAKHIGVRTVNIVRRKAQVQELLDAGVARARGVGHGRVSRGRSVAVHEQYGLVRSV